MHLEGCRIAADWFGNGSFGVNAQLATIPLDAGDVAPLNLATITDATHDGNVARDEPPSTLPGLGVSIDHIKDLDGQVQTITADGQMKLRVRIDVSNSLSANGWRDLSYYLRATLKSLRLLLLDAHAASRTRNNIYLETALSIEQAIAIVKNQQSGTDILSAFLLVTIQMRDLAP